MRQGRVLAAAAILTLAVPASAAAFTGEPPVHPTEGKWQGHTAGHNTVNFNVHDGAVHNFRSGHVGTAITFDRAVIRHGHFTGHDNDRVDVSGTFQKPENPGHHARHLIGTFYLPGIGGRVTRVSFKAHPEDSH